MKKDLEKWLSTPLIEEKMKQELKNASQNEIEDFFFENLVFGTGGMRGLLGPGPNRMNTLTIAQASFGFGKSLLEKFAGKVESIIVIGYDNRHYSKEFAELSAEILSALGIRVLLAKRLTATPIVSYAIRKNKAQGGIMITASHNPPEYNGFKIYDQTGCQYLPDEINNVAKEIKKVYGNFDFKRNRDLIDYLNEDIEEDYVNEFGAYINENEKILSVGYSGQHGTGSIPIRKIFTHFNFDCFTVIKEQEKPDPNFSNTSSPNPENPIAFEKLIDLGHKEHLDLLLTTDPDADRMGAFYRDSDQYIRLTGNQIGAIFSYYLAEKGMYQHDSYLVKTVVSSDLGAKIAKDKGINTVEVLTGFKYIGDTINCREEKDFFLGYEESFGYLYNPIVRDKDGIQAALLLAEIANELKMKDKTFSNYLAEIYDKYGFYKEDLYTIETVGQDKMEKIKKLMDALSEKFEGDAVERADYLIGKVENFLTKEVNLINLPSENAIKYTFYDRSWVCIRPSGTEPKLKIYYGVSTNDVLSGEKKMIEFKKIIEEIQQTV